MNFDQLAGNWNQFKGKVQQKWANLTEDDLMKIQGNKNELLGKIQERQGIAKEKAQKELDDFLNGLD